MKKEKLLELINQLPDNSYIVLNEVSFDGTPNFKPIEKIEYEDYNKVYIIK
ncbi:MAG: hypothetical protein ABTA16_00350 [Niallia sp.]